MPIWTRLLLAGLVSSIGLTSGVGSNLPSADAQRLQGVPELPRILSARVVLGTRYGTAVRVSYCFRSFSTDPDRGPWRLSLTVDNLRDQQPPLNVPWKVTKRCDIVIHPVGGIQQPYVLRYFVESRNGTRSGERQIRLADLPALNRKPQLPQRIEARVVKHPEYGKAVRVSYCFSSLPRDLSRRPSYLAITVRNARDRFQSHGYNTSVEKRCGVTAYPVAGIDPPYVVTYIVVSKNNTYSKRASVVVR